MIENGISVILDAAPRALRQSLKKIIYASAAIVVVFALQGKANAAEGDVQEIPSWGQLVIGTMTHTAVGPLVQSDTYTVLSGTAYLFPESLENPFHLNPPPRFSVAARRKIKQLVVEYYIDNGELSMPDQITISTTTLVYPTTWSYTFGYTFSLPLTNARSFNYRIMAVVDHVIIDSTTGSASVPFTGPDFDDYICWPTNGGFYSAAVNPPGAGAQNSTTTVAAVGANGGTLSLADASGQGGQPSSLTIPPGALDSDVNVRITRIDPNDNQAIARYGAISKTFYAAPGERPVVVFLIEPAGLVLKRPAPIALAYHDAMQDGKVDETGEDETQQMIKYWDGYQWRAMGGQVNVTPNTISLQITRFGTYAIFRKVPMTDNDYRPGNKFITPNGDAFNPDASFGPITQDSVINIYDVTGKRIRQLKDSNVWDAKDDDGDIVESGLYIYQIKIPGRKLISGTIVVAK